MKEHRNYIRWENKDFFWKKLTSRVLTILKGKNASKIYFGG